MKVEITGLPNDLTSKQQGEIGLALLRALNITGTSVNDVRVQWVKYDTLKQGEGMGDYRIYEKLPDIGLGKLIRLWGTTNDHTFMSYCLEGFDGHEFIVITHDYYTASGVPSKYRIVP